MDRGEDPVEITLVTLECRTCAHVRRLTPDPVLRSIDEFERFMGQQDPCPKCGHDKAMVSVTMPSLN